MRELEGFGINGLSVSRQIQLGHAHLAFISPSLASREEELARKDFVDEGVLVGGGCAHGFEIGDSKGH